MQRRRVVVEPLPRGVGMGAQGVEHTAERIANARSISALAHIAVV